MSRQLRLEDLARDIPVLTAAAAAFYQENCVVCLVEGGHQSGVALEVLFEGTSEIVNVQWQETVTPQMLRAYADKNKRVDFAACAIALLLIKAFTPYVTIEQSATGNGIDYIMQRADSDDELIFNNGAYLEVSGIGVENTANTIADRLQSKRRRLQRQAKSANARVADLPTYICIVEFGTPQAVMVIA